VQVLLGHRDGSMAVHVVDDAKVNDEREDVAMATVRHLLIGCSTPARAASELVSPHPMRTFMIKMSVAVVVAVAAVTLATSAASATAGSATQSAAIEEYLFTVQAARGTTTPLKSTGPVDETFRLTLVDIDPVTMFANRPFRDASLISPQVLTSRWKSWFGGNPPNAVLTYARSGRAPGSMVIEIDHPTYNAAARTITFTATRLSREHDPIEKGANWQRLTTPSSMTSVSLFIDLVQSKKKEP